MKLCVMALLLTPLACGTVVDMGGPFDASVTRVGECSPCNVDSDCTVGLSCAIFRGDLYCVTPCSTGGTCSGVDTCESTSGADAGAISACLPTSGTCEIDVPVIIGPDGGPLVECGAVVGPTIAGNCKACSKSASDCQANGCYGGYWCDTSIHDCSPAPKSCQYP